eukprot:TRINITY_DN3971_c0_g1_i4.p1 TRINITY_DN3971_c0_g1~~TRINITY_DN3971_c0_g1_i4.p1  ORF type:complete len:209 (-),score=38.02 TRINITY_DN3971_c0_g1_i4:69-665(-)
MEELNHLLYVQALSEVLSENYAAPHEVVVSLVALNIQVDIAGDAAQLAAILSTKTQKYFPPSFLKDKKTTKATTEEVGAAVPKLKGKTPEECKVEYLRTVFRLPSYGCVMFPCELKNPPQGTPSKIVLGVGGTAIHFLDVTRMKCHNTYAYSDIDSWGSNERTLVIQTAGVSPQKFQLKTTRGKDVCDLLTEYTNDGV